MLTCTHCGGLTPRDLGSKTCLHCDAALARPPRWARRLSVLLGPAGAILLAACYGAPGRYHMHKPNGPGGATRVDNDRDGALGPWVCPPHMGPSCEAEIARMPPPPDLDCDDKDPRRYPGAEDVDGDGLDQNCDGVDGWRDPNTVVTPIATEPPPSDPAHVTVPAPTP